MKRSYDEVEHTEDESNKSGVLDTNKVYDMQKKEIWVQMKYYKDTAKKYESQLLSFKSQINTLRLYLLSFLSRFSTEPDYESFVDELLNNPEDKNVDKVLVSEIKRISAKELDEIDVLKGRLGHSKLQLEEYEKSVAEIREELAILKRRSFKQLQDDRSHIVYSSPQIEPGETIVEGDLGNLKSVIEEQRNEISLLIQKCSSLEKEKEALAHIRRIIPSNLLADPSYLGLILNKYHDIEENNKALGLLMERYRKDFDEMCSRNKISFEDLKNNCTQSIEAQFEKTKNIREESVRLRQERDKMRTLYEENNSALSHANKRINHLQKLMSTLEMKHDSFEKGLGKRELLTKLVDSLKDGEYELKLKSMLETESQLSEELDLLTKAFDDMQASYKELLKNFDEKCESHTKLLSEKLKSDFQCTQLSKEMEMAQTQANSSLALSQLKFKESVDNEIKTRSLVTDLEQKITESNGRLVQIQSKYQDAKVKLEHYSKQNELLSSQKELPALSQKIDECAALKEENIKLKEKLQFRGGDSGTADELGLYRKLLYCNSCHINPKNTVLLKCMHVFCRNCIDIRLETRQRKCPNCGDPFSANDVKSIYL